MKTMADFGITDVSLVHAHLAYKHQLSVFQNFSTVVRLLGKEGNLAEVKTQLQADAKDDKPIDTVSML